MQQTGQIGLTKDQWIEIILNHELTLEIDISIFQALYSFNAHKAYASQIGLLLGVKEKSLHAPINLEIGRYAMRGTLKHESYVSIIGALCALFVVLTFKRLTAILVLVLSMFTI